MYNTAMIANVLALALKIPNWGDSDRGKLYGTALTHDLPETISGDLPTPLKRIVNMADPIINETFWEGKRGRPPEDWDIYHAIVGIADLMEAMIFIHTEGATPRAKVIEKLQDADFEKLLSEAAEKWPDLPWDHCAVVYDEVITGIDNGNL